MFNNTLSHWHKLKCLFCNDKQCTCTSMKWKKVWGTEKEVNNNIGTAVIWVNSDYPDVKGPNSCVNHILLQFTTKCQILLVQYVLNDESFELDSIVKALAAICLLFKFSPSFHKEGSLLGHPFTKKNMSLRIGSGMTPFANISGIISNFNACKKKLWFKKKIFGSLCVVNIDNTSMTSLFMASSLATYWHGRSIFSFINSPLL